MTQIEREFPALTDPHPLSLPAGDAVHLWFARAGEGFRHPRDREMPPPELSPEEVARAARFRDHRSRIQFVTGREMLRGLLHGYLGEPPGPDAIRIAPAGKPFLAGGTPGPRLEFSLSHAGAWVVLAFSSGAPVGVDVEGDFRPESPEAVDALAERVFSPREMTHLRELSEEARARGFTRGWTRKEALLKALGAGFGFPPGRLEVGLTPEARTLRVPAGTHPEGAIPMLWTVCSVEAPPGHAASVARAGGPFRIEIRGCPGPG